MFSRSPSLTGVWDFWCKIRRVVKASGVSWRAFPDIVRRTWAKLKLLDRAEQLASTVRPYEIERGKATKTLHQALKIIDNARTFKELQAAGVEVQNLFEAIPQDKSRKPLRVGLIGEIYVVLEPFMNLEIEKTLGEMGVAPTAPFILPNGRRQIPWPEASRTSARQLTPI